MAHLPKVWNPSYYFPGPMMGSQRPHLSAPARVSAVRATAMTVSHLYSSNGIYVNVVHTQRGTSPLTNVPSMDQLLKQLNNLHPQNLPNIAQKRAGVPNSATTTPAGPYSASTDILTPYHSTDNTPRFPSPDDLRVGNGTLAELDRRRNHRPLSRKDSRKSLTITSKEKALSLEREKEQQTQNGKDENSSMLKNSFFKPNGMRNNYLSGQQVSPSHRASLTGTPTEFGLEIRKSTAGPVSDDLVAMGTNWNPHGMHLRSGAGGSRERPGSFGPASNHHISVSHISPQLSVTQAPTVMGPRRVGKTSSLSHFTGASHRTREVEPKYPDPMHVAPPSFQQRISELATLESETIRWERTRRIKKKPKDS